MPAEIEDCLCIYKVEIAHVRTSGRSWTGLHAE